MKNIKVTDIGAIKNELRKYKAGKKLDINQFNQVARLAWLGKIVMQPLDPMDADTKSWLLYADYPDPMAEHALNIDQDLIGQMHIVDSEQGEALAKVLEQGIKERMALYQDLKQRDFYFDHFYHGDGTDDGG
jgi:hypothetical protein